MMLQSSIAPFRSTAHKCLAAAKLCSSVRAQRAARPRLPLRSGVVCLAAPSTTSSSSADAESDIQQQLQRSCPAQQSHYDMNFWHYQPWWMQPGMVVAAGVLFMLIALLVDDKPSLKTCIIAAGPVALFWGILLFLLPQQFQKFAIKYLKEHPQDGESAPQ